MMKKNYLIILVLLSFQLYSQQFQWLATPPIVYNSNPSNISYPSASDSQGNTFVCGFKDTPFHYNDTFGNLWLLKYDTNGQLLFSKTLNGTVCAYAMQTDSAGNLYVAAAYLTELHIDNLNISGPLQSRNPILLKFNSNGDLLWHKLITGDFVDHFKGLAIDSNQNVYIGYDNFGDSFIEKLDVNGNSLLLITQSDVNMISAIDVDNQGNIYGVGSCASMNSNFNGTPITTSFLYNTYIVKYNPTGQFQWMHFVNDITCPEPQIAVDTPDEVYFCSYLFGAYSFGSVPTEGPVTGAFSDFFLAKLNANGVYQWVKEVPGSGRIELGQRNFLTLDSYGNPYLAAKTRGTIQWSPTISTQGIGFSGDIIVLKYNPQGNIQWAKTAGGASDDRTDGITILPDGDVVITGMSYGTAYFDALSYTSATTYFPYVAKIDTSMLGNQQWETTTSMSVYPNPAKNTVTLHSADYRGTAQLYSLLGQELKRIAITSEETLIDISELAVGTYFIRLGNSKVNKLVKI